MKKILLVDDDDKIRKVLHNFLSKNGYLVYEADNGMNALKLYKDIMPDITILDVMMPIMDGWATCREIRKISDKPIIMATALSGETDELLGFELGVNDYIKKPISLNILSARIKAIIGNEEKDRLLFKDLIIDLSSHKVSENEEFIILSPKEYELLVYLANNHNIALSREKILNAVWDIDYYGDLRTVDTHIKKVRKKLKKDYIKTVRGFGYRFEVE